MPKRKKITMLVTVSVNSAMTAAEARREVRSLISHQANWFWDEDDIKCAAARPAPKGTHS
jgi:hypothetical protein